MKSKFDENSPMQVGGQAVIEGVMMRAPGRVATAVRRPDGTIALRSEEFRSLADRYRLLKAPILRGAVGLIEMLALGIKTLNYSAEVSLQNEGVTEDSPSRRTGEEVSPQRKRKDSLILGLTVAGSLVAGAAIFFVTPLLVTTALFSVEQDPIRFNLVAGIIRLVLLLGYLAGISMMKDVRRLFEYHGAEHKSVFAFESGGDLDVATAAVQTRFHPRCGTSFLLLVMLVAIVLFGVLDAILIAWLGKLTLALRLATHLPLIPLVGGVSYECIRIAARKSTTRWGRLVVAPGLWLQHITTKEPDGQQLEVALVALRAALGMDAPSCAMVEDEQAAVN